MKQHLLDTFKAVCFGVFVLFIIWITVVVTRDLVEWFR